MEEKMVMEIEEKRGMTTGQKLLTVGGVVAAGVIGYKFGKVYTLKCIDIGLEMMAEADPTFRNHFWEALGKAKVVFGVKE